MTKEIKEQLAKILESSKNVEVRLTSIEERLDSLETLQQAVASIEADNIKLRADVNFLIRRDNDREQYLRNSSIRVFDLPIEKDDQNNPFKVMKTLYTNVLEPILRVAKDAGDIDDIPKVLDLLETAHILPLPTMTPPNTRSRPNAPAPIIARFKSRPFRSLIFKHKKAFFLTNKVLKVSVVEDLTSITYAKLQKLKKNPDIASAWTINGKIRYTAKTDDKKILKLNLITDEPNL